MLVERDVVDVYRAIYMQDHVGEELDGRISGFAPFGIYVQVEDPFVSVLLPFEQLDDTFEPDDLGIRLIGARTSKIFTMNDPVTVRVEDVNVQTRDVVGSLVEHQVADAPTEARRRQRRPDQKQRAPEKRSSGQEARRDGPRKRRRRPRKR
jgi:ribonuclease R